MFKISAAQIDTQYLLNGIQKIIIVSIFLWFLHLYLCQRRLYKSVANITSVPGLPVIGHLRFLFQTSDELSKELCTFVRDYKFPMKCWLGPYLYIGIINAENIKIVLNNPNTLGKDKLYTFLKSQKTLLGAPVEFWRKQRKLVAPSFNQKLLISFIEIFEKNSIILNNSLEINDGKGEFNASPFFFRSTLNSVVETVFGSSSCSHGSFNDYAQNLSRHFELINQRMKNIFYYVNIIYNISKFGKEHRQTTTYLKKFALEIIENKIKEREKTNVKNKNENAVKKAEEINENLSNGKERKRLIDLIIENSTDDTKEDLLRLSCEMIIAGTETAALTSGFVLMMLGMHLDIQDAVYSEIYDIFGSSDRSITVEDLSAMHYTEMVIKETMRLFPAIPIIARESTADIQLEDDQIIPSGSGIIMPIWVIHRNPKIWPNPLKFDPDRFSYENAEKRNPYSYIPFSGGPRNCIGYRYAMMSLKTTIATFIRKYKVRCAYKSPADIKVNFMISLKPLDGHLISIENRSVNNIKLTNNITE